MIILVTLSMIMHILRDYNNNNNAVDVNLFELAVVNGK